MDEAAFHVLAESLLDEIPEELLDGLNGGVRIESDAMQREPDLTDVYVLAEYVTDTWLGSQIVIYYGSFAALFADLPEGVWEHELRTTIRHELRHHIERRAGLDDLGVEDELELERLRRREQRRRKRKRRSNMDES